MGYSDQIDILKKALDGYSEEENKLSALYKTAIENAEKAHMERKRQLEEQYYHDRNTAYADNAKAERNTFNTLAARGLGFSGEAAQAKLNSNISLANRLGALAREKLNAEAGYNLELADNISNLSIEESEKTADLMKHKNDLNASIAGMELERETGEAERAADEESENKKLAAEKEALQLQIQADKDLQAAELAAERDMFDAELAAKYYSSGSSGGSGNGSAGNTTAEEEEQSVGYTPEISAKELAKQLVNSATGGNLIDGATHEYMVNKYLLQLRTNYDINPDYYDELIFMLKAYGYEEISEPEMRVQVISTEAEAYYSNMYDELYDQYVVSGLGEESARSKAISDSAEKRFDYIYNRCENLTEFRMCCLKLGISSREIQEYINRLKSVKAGSPGNTGGGRYPTMSAK